MAACRIEKLRLADRAEAERWRLQAWDLRCEVKLELYREIVSQGWPCHEVVWRAEAWYNELAAQARLQTMLPSPLEEQTIAAT